MLTHVKFLCGQTDGRTDQIPPNLRLPGGGGHKTFTVHYVDMHIIVK